MKKSAKGAEEYVMVFATDILHQLGYFQGLSFETEKYLNFILDRGNYKFMQRKVAEEDSSYKQLIPYVILQHQREIFSYRRGKLLSEKRLLGNYSIGIGGHISIDDPSLFGTIYSEGVHREVREEVNIETDYTEKAVGLINDDTTEVGKVHFGVVHVFTLNEPLVKPREKSINETGFHNISELIKDIDKFENWSQICIKDIDTLIRY
ncbi:MAG: hypothetical protein WC560_06175 [Syntrophales bacterium]